MIAARTAISEAERKDYAPSTSAGFSAIDGDRSIRRATTPDHEENEDMEQYLWILKDKERDLIRELEPDRLAEQDEEGLLALHKRIRRARNKHTTNYRRGAAEKVGEAGGRGAAASGSAKARGRAYVFEEALSLVSAELARVAHDAAEVLKDERLARARAGRSTGPQSDGIVGPGSSEGRAREHQQTTGGVKRDASTRAQGARRQAKRDAR
jgi:hypothetical protein